MPYLGSSPRNTNTRSVIDHQSYLGSQADTSTNSGYYTFYCNYTIGNVSVILRGVHMADSDYTATNGTDIRISSSSFTINNDDVIEIIGHTVPSSQILERSDVSITGGAISNAVLNNTNTYYFLDDSISGDKIDGGTISDSVLKLKSTGNSIVASDGTTGILSESGNAVSIGTLRLPTSGGIQDSSGANVLTEASGTVTLTADEANVGSNALVVDASGNVGIGTSSPTSAVTIREDSSGSKVELLRLENLGGGSNEGAIIGFYSDDGKYADIETSHSTFNYGNLSLRAYDNDHSTVASEIRLSGTTGTTDEPFISFTTNASERMRIDSAGQINMYDVYSDTVTGRDLYIASTGKLGYLSSIRDAKINISNLESVNWLYSLNPVSFQYRTKDEEDNYTDIPEKQIEYGLIAEEVETVNSDLVFYDETENGLELRGVQYSRLIAPLIKAVQQQKTLIESQQSQIDALTARIEALEATP